MKFLRLILVAALAVSIGSLGVVYGAVIEEAVVCHDFDVNGYPVPQDQFPVSVDAVIVWVNITDIHVNDSLVFEWWPPEGDMHYEETLVAPLWLDSMPHNGMFTEMEVMGEPAENMSGVWVVDIYNNGTWWGHVTFELVSEDTPSMPSIDDIPMNILGIAGVETPDSFNPGDTVSVKVSLGYNFNSSTDIAPSIWNNNSQSFVGSVEDTVNGLGIKTYAIDFVADETDTLYYVIAYYTSGEEYVFSEEAGLLPFRLEDESVAPDISGIDEIDLPTDINFEEIQNQISDYVDRLMNINITLPDASDIEEEIKERTGIPGYPLEAIALGVAALIYLARRRE